MGSVGNSSRYYSQIGEEAKTAAYNSKLREQKRIQAREEKWGWDRTSDEEALYWADSFSSEVREKIDDLVDYFDRNKIPILETYPYQDPSWYDKNEISFQGGYTDRRSKAFESFEIGAKTEKSALEQLHGNGYNLHRNTLLTKSLYKYTIDRTNATDEDFRAAQLVMRAAMKRRKKK